MERKSLGSWGEDKARLAGHQWICGCDEAGAGPLAGPVYAAAVVLPRDTSFPGLDDSKKLTAKRREALYDEIIAKALAWAVAAVGPEEIDEIDILNARMLAMNRAIAQLEPRPELALIDGSRNNGIELASRCVVKGDSLCADIAAASVLAKVSRDRYMLQMDELYPQYCFRQHKGYGTKLHYEALREYGPSPIHRMSFLRKMH